MAQELEPKPLELIPYTDIDAPERHPLYATLRTAISPSPLHIASPNAIVDEFRERRKANSRYRDWPEKVAGPLLGYLSGTGPMFYKQEGHRLVLGQSGGGKGSAVIVPLLLHDDGHAAIVVDPKSGAIARATLDYRKQLAAPVHVFDPYNATGLFPDGGSARYNPLAAIDPDSPTLVEDAAHLASAICYDPQSNGGGDTRYWDEQSRSFITGLIVHLVTQPGERANFLRLREIAVMPLEDFKSDIVEKMLYNSAAGGTVKRYGHEFARNLALNPKNFDSVFSNIRSYTRWTEFQGVRNATADSTFDFCDVRQLGGTVYIIVPDTLVEQSAPWLRVILQAARISLQRDNSRNPIHFVIDETSALGRFDMITAGLRAWREDNIKLHLFFQNIAQIKKSFGDAYSAVTDAEIIQFLGSNELDTIKYVSELIGERDMIIPTKTEGENWGTNSGQSTTVGQSENISSGSSISQSKSITRTLGNSWSLAEGRSTSSGLSSSQSNGTSQSSTIGSSFSETDGVSMSISTGSSTSSSQAGSTHGSSSSRSLSSSHSTTTGYSESFTQGWSRSITHGTTQSSGQSSTSSKGGNESAAQGVTHGRANNESRSTGTSK